ncbi:molybdenum cofactor guanylyltransferase [Nesterenkonia suensis]
MPPEGRTTAAILLAGGRGSRLGGVEKGMLARAGVPLVAAWAEALARRDIRTVVVGPHRLRAQLPLGTRLTREDPPYSGPAAALCAGVRALEDEAADQQTGWQAGQPEGQPAGRPTGLAAERPQHLLLLAVDTLDPSAVLDWLLARLPETGALIPQDAAGRAQMLTAAVEAEPLRRRVLSLVPGEEVGRPVRWLLEGMDDAGAPAVSGPRLPEGLGADVDTISDARRHGVSLPELGIEPDSQL